MATVRVPFVVRNRVWSFRVDDRGANDYIVAVVQRDGLAGYERPLPLLLAGLALVADENFLDIGANTGIYSLLYSSLAPSADVYAFEPLRNIAQALEDNVRLNPSLAERIHIQPFALSDRSGNIPFYETINDRGFISTSSSLEQSRASAIGEYRETKVTTCTLDTFSSEHSVKFGVAKIDVEGHEAAVLAGAHKTIAANRPILIVEVLRDANCHALNNWAATVGYVTYAACADCLLRLDGVEHVAGTQNHVLCPNEQREKLARVTDFVGVVLA